MPEEIDKIVQCDCSHIPYLQNAKDISLFQYYSGGLRISDALLLQWDNIKEKRAYFTIRKTGKQASNKLSEKALALIDKYRNLNSRFIFNYFPESLDLDDLFKVDNLISAKTALVNKALKKIANLSSINKSLSTHIFRHSFATNALQQNMSLDVLQKVLRHSSIRETQIYAQVLNKKIDIEMDKLDL